MSGAGLDSRYIAGLELEDYFVSNQNGEANAGGIVTFYKDNNRTEQKLVYQLSQDPMTGAYSYVPLPNPMTLSGVGTFQDAAGDNVAVYYFPFDEFGNIELYYITVYDAFGNLQFTREAWPFPNVGSGGGSIGTELVGIANQLSNPQFAFVNFAANGTLTIPISTATTTTFEIAPDWTINIVSTAATIVTVTQTPVFGSSAYPNNPPYTLDFVIGSNITSCQLIQTLNNNPDWAAPASTIGGYLAGSILLGNGTSVSMQYKPSAGNAAQTILSATNTSGSYAQETGTIQLEPANNPQSGATGYDQIIINLLNLPGAASISNVQVVPLTTDVDGVQFDQTPVNRQLDQLFNYYKSQLAYKASPSWLVGWNFPFNPAQPLGASISAQAIGANKSYYAWDQTIVFQSVTSGLTISRDTTGALKVLVASASATRHALVQYIPAPQAIEMLSRKKCVMVCANASVATNATVSLWYTKTTLPSTIGSNNSIVATLDSAGYPATLNGTWTQVPRSGLGYNGITTGSTNAAQFTIGTAPSGAASFNQYPLSGWDMAGDTDINSATFFAIVVGTANMAQNAYILWQDISCQDGDIPTISAPKTVTQVLSECQYYYEMSFPVGTVPASNLGSTSGASYGNAGNTVGGHNLIEYFKFRVQKYAIPTTTTAYNPSAAGAQAHDVVTNTDCTNTAVQTVDVNGIIFRADLPGGGNVGDLLSLHWTTDSRLAQ